MSNSELINIKEEEVISEVRLDFSKYKDYADFMRNGPLSGLYLDLELIDSLIEIVGTKEFQDLIFAIVNMPLIDVKNHEDLGIVVNRSHIAKKYLEFRDLDTPRNEFVLMHLLCYRIDSALRDDFFDATTEANCDSLDNLIQFLLNYVLKSSDAC